MAAFMEPPSPAREDRLKRRANGPLGVIRRLELSTWQGWGAPVFRCAGYVTRRLIVFSIRTPAQNPNET